MAADSKIAKFMRSPFLWIPVALCFPFLMEMVMTIHSTTFRKTNGPSPIMIKTHMIGTAVWQYTLFHHGAYPEGKSSTEVFQQLINEEFITDPTVFFEERFKIPGKTKASSRTLRPENVCWDVTVPLDSNSPDALPLVFLTGFRVQYTSGGSATPLFPWAKDWTGIAVLYKGDGARWLMNDRQPNGMVTNFISQAFEPAGKKYVQLTPDGPLGP